MYNAIQKKFQFSGNLIVKLFNRACKNRGCEVRFRCIKAWILFGFLFYVDLFLEWTWMEITILTVAFNVLLLSASFFKRIVICSFNIASWKNFAVFQSNIYNFTPVSVAVIKSVTLFSQQLAANPSRALSRIVNKPISFVLFYDYPSVRTFYRISAFRSHSF